MESQPDFKRYIKELREHENAADESNNDLAAHEAKKVVYLFHKTFTKYQEEISEDLEQKIFLIKLVKKQDNF